MKAFRAYGLIVLATLTMAALAFAAFAAVVNVPDDDYDVGAAKTRSESTAAGTLTAGGGNVSSLNVTGEDQTNWWHGFYGVVNHTIVLDDASNTTFFSWSNSEPNGEIFFVNASSATWSGVATTNLVWAWSREVIGQGMAPSGLDVYNKTYNVTYTHPDFDVDTAGTQSGSVCVRLQSGNFWGVLLSSDADSRAIYTAIINQSQTGFDGGTYDFEILLPTSGAQRTYYVFSELE